VKRRRTPRRPGLDDVRYRNNRETLKATGDHICHACRFPIDMQRRHPDPLSWSCDHRWPRSTLHPDDPRHWHISALLEAHLRCNESRGAKPLWSLPLPATPPPDIDW